MLMPIVSMNKMAMNESVATTCCYREVATPTAMYWEVLNGGWIGSGYVDGATRNSAYQYLNKSWLDYKYDVIFTAGPDPDVDMSASVRYESLLYPAGATTAVSNWYVYGTDGLLLGTMSEYLGGLGVPTRTDETCDHKTNSKCVYNTIGATFKENQHFESKTKHTTGGTDWAKPHTADKFSS